MEIRNKKFQERRFEFQARAVEVDNAEQRELWVEGYASVFDSPTVLFEYDGVEYTEQIAAGAFTDCRMADVIFNYNHQGKVMARTRNNTLTVSVDQKGLFVRARLDGTEEGRTLYDEISKGYIDRMSFRFAIGEEAYDYQNHKWTVLRIKRVYDVSAVDIPAYDDTTLEARRADAERDALERRQAAAAAATLRERVLILTKLG